MQAYFIIRPEARVVVTDALLKGGLFAGRPKLEYSTNEITGFRVKDDPGRNIRPLVYAINYGALLSTGKFSISFMQTASTELMKDTYSHEVGNISLFFIL